MELGNCWVRSVARVAYLNVEMLPALLVQSIFSLPEVFISVTAHCCTYSERKVTIWQAWFVLK